MSALQDEILAAVREANRPLVTEIEALKSLLEAKLVSEGNGLLSLKEAAKYTGLHADTLRRQFKSGNLPGIRLGNQIRLDPKDLNPSKA